MEEYYKALTSVANRKEFLKDLKNRMKKSDLSKKHRIKERIFNKRIRQLFGPGGPTNYTKAINNLKDRDVDEVLNEIEKKNDERQIVKIDSPEIGKEKGHLKPKQVPEKFKLKDFVIELCDRKGEHTNYLEDLLMKKLKTKP